MMCKYWFIELENGEFAGFESEIKVSNQEVKNVMLSFYGLVIREAYPTVKPDLYWSEVDIY